MGFTKNIEMIAALLVVSTITYPYPWAPGAVDPNCTKEDVCQGGYTETVRPSVSFTNKIKKAEILSHQEIDCSKGCELDHVVSLELCGAPGDVMNLAIEPYFPKPGAREKDQAEDFLHRQVCKGNMTLEEAQELIRTDWLEIYNGLHKK
jgi:hypothetical protein